MRAGLVNDNMRFGLGTKFGGRFFGEVGFVTESYIRQDATASGVSVNTANQHVTFQPEVPCGSRRGALAFVEQNQDGEDGERVESVLHLQAIFAPALDIMLPDEQGAGGGGVAVGRRQLRRPAYRQARRTRTRLRSTLLLAKSSGCRRRCVGVPRGAHTARRGMLQSLVSRNTSGTILTNNSVGVRGFTSFANLRVSGQFFRRVKCGGFAFRATVERGERAKSRAGTDVP